MNLHVVAGSQAENNGIVRVNESSSKWAENDVIVTSPLPRSPLLYSPPTFYITLESLGMHI